jgi:hypothetical protein
MTRSEIINQLRRAPARIGARIHGLQQRLARTEDALRTAHTGWANALQQQLTHDAERSVLLSQLFALTAAWHEQAAQDNAAARYQQQAGRPNTAREYAVAARALGQAATELDALLDAAQTHWTLSEEEKNA